MAANYAIMIKAQSIVPDYDSNVSALLDVGTLFLLSASLALLVQLVERRSPKPDVGGSSPPGRAS